MEENKKMPPIVTTLILSVITSIFWIFFDVYRSLTKEPEVTVPAELLLPLNPKLDVNTIELIKSKNYLDSVPELYTPTNSIPSTPISEAELEESPQEASGEAVVKPDL